MEPRNSISAWYALIGLVIGLALGWYVRGLADNQWQDAPPGRLAPDAGLRVKTEFVYVPFVRVVDGDTIKVMWEGKEISVRMLRIDTPERGQPGYDEATEYLRKLIGDPKQVALDFEKPGKIERDRYGRLLAYVWLDGKNLCVEMVKAGHSRFWTKYGEGKYAEAFRAADKP